MPLEYFQGVTTDRAGDFYFDGIQVGIYRTDPLLAEEARLESGIPVDVYLREGYNHIGDITWDKREGGRVLLPLECFLPFFGNTCKTGSIGVADPDTLQWRYYVKLDKAFIDKAMWAEVSPNGQLLWTSSGSGDDLLAYRREGHRPAQRRAGRARRSSRCACWTAPCRRAASRAPRSTASGCSSRGRAAGRSGSGRSTCATAPGRLEIEKTVIGESEGLEMVDALGGVLHWLITPFQTGGRPPTYGRTSALVHFVPAPGTKMHK